VRDPKAQAVFARRLTRFLSAVEEYQGVKQAEIARRMNCHPNLISNYKNPKYQSGPPKPIMFRRLEQALGLPKGALERDDPADLKALRRPSLAAVANDGPSAVQRAATFVLGQLQVYSRAGLPVPPQIVVVLATELETAMGESPGDASGGAPSGSVSPGGG
jgi:transcriptional regulator with XRE-family HTH domain